MNREEKKIVTKINKNKCYYIKALVEDKTGIIDISIRNRNRRIADAKKIYCYLCKKFTTASLALIGQCLGNGYDHSTVIHNIKEFEKIYDSKQIYFYDEISEMTDCLIKDGNLEVEKSAVFDDSKMIGVYKSKALIEHETNKRLMSFIHKNAERLILN